MEAVVQGAQVQLFTEALRVKPPTPDEVDAYLARTRLAEVLDKAANDAVKRQVRDPFAHVAVHCLSESAHRKLGHITASRVQDLARTTQREEDLHRLEADMNMEIATMRKQMQDAQQVATDAKHAKELLEEQVIELKKALRQSRSNAPAAAVTALRAMEARAEAAETKAASQEMRAQKAEKRAEGMETRLQVAESQIQKANDRANEAEAKAGAAAKQAREAAQAAKSAQVIADDAEAEAAAVQAEKAAADAKRLESVARQKAIDAKKAGDDVEAYKANTSAKAPAATPAAAPATRTTPGELGVVVVKANGLAAADKSGTSDPFIRMTVTGSKQKEQKTKVIKKTLNPVWNESFTFGSILDDRAELVLTLWDDDGYFQKADPLGEVRITLKDVAGLKRNGEWITLPPKSVVAGQASKSAKNLLQAQGTLEVMLSWVEPLTAGTPVAAAAPSTAAPAAPSSEGGPPRRISFADEDTPRVHASKIFHFLERANGGAGGGGNVGRAQLAAFAACVVAPGDQRALHSTNANNTEASRAFAWVLLRMAVAKDRYTQNEYLDAIDNGPKPFGGGYKWAAQYAAGVRSISSKLDSPTKADKLKREMEGQPKDVPAVRTKYQEDDADLLFSFLVDGTHGVVQRFRLRALAQTIEGGVSQSQQPSAPEKEAISAFVKTLEQLADKKDHYSRKALKDALNERGGNTPVALQRTAGVLRDDGLASGLQKAMVKAMIDDTMSLVYRFLDAPRKSGVDDASIVQLAATLYKASEAQGDLRDRNATKGMVRVLATMAKQAKHYDFGQWKAFKVPEPPQDFRDGAEQDHAVFLMHSVLDSKTSTVGVRKQMEKERMDLNTLCQAVRL